MSDIIGFQNCGFEGKNFSTRVIDMMLVIDNKVLHHAMGSRDRAPVIIKKM